MLGEYYWSVTFADGNQYTQSSKEVSLRDIGNAGVVRFTAEPTRKGWPQVTIRHIPPSVSDFLFFKLIRSDRTELDLTAYPKETWGKVRQDHRHYYQCIGYLVGKTAYLLAINLDKPIVDQLVVKQFSYHRMIEDVQCLQLS